MKGVSPLRNSLDKLLPLLILFALVLPVCGQETATVLQVIDGETIKIEYHGAREIIRLIGIDAPPNRASRYPRAYARGTRSGRLLCHI